MSDIKQRFRHGLEVSRAATEKILDEFTNPEDWVRRPAPGTNHAMWIAGHLAVVDGRLSRFVSREYKCDLSKYLPLFAKSTTPLDNLSDYPPIEEVRQLMRDMRAMFLRALEECPEERFVEPTPDGVPPFFKNVGHVFQMAAWHEGIHTGQLSTIHRILGNRPLTDRG
ncbi:DinB family protein [Rubinisphaera margarita]|uniref:DinB family protein n=1 Tax=Rubinisphaera margarita TaxID=2909586 RepID=UPI001EE95E79|nr:DinB family protein [Rubinisphaera margarita]MCG6156811.1 DinB family protein [Rubinisphaera margarita]